MARSEDGTEADKMTCGTRKYQQFRKGWEELNTHHAVKMALKPTIDLQNWKVSAISQKGGKELNAHPDKMQTVPAPLLHPEPKCKHQNGSRTNVRTHHPAPSTNAVKGPGQEPN